MPSKLPSLLPPNSTKPLRWHPEQNHSFDHTRSPANTAKGVRLRTMTLICLALLSSLLFSGLLPTSAQALEPLRTHYKIQAQLDYEQGELTASEVVTYYNDIGQPLDSIVFNVTPAHFDAFQLLETTVEGQRVQPTLNGEILEVPLPRSLQPGTSTAIQIDFSLVVPTPGNLRFGRGNDIMALGNWCPIVAVWKTDDGSGAPGWARYHYVDTGDAFFSAIGDYDVSLDVNTAVSIAHTGDLVQQNGSLWVFRASRVRDFALAISPRYETSSATVGDTTITAFYLPEHKSAGEQYLKSASESAAWFNANLYQYPYSTLHIAETNTADPSWVGQEYPNVVFISNQVSAAGGGIGTYLDYLVVHEVLHQWFYGLVGNDQVLQPWVDEAPVVYVTYMYFRANYPAVYESFWQSCVSNYEAAIQTWGDMPVDTSIYDYNNENHYFAMVYRQGAVFLDELRELMGDESFFAFLRQYLRDHAYGIATASDFLTSAQANSSANIAAVVGKYLTQSSYQALSPIATAEPTPTITPSSEPTPMREISPQSPTATTNPTISPTVTVTATEPPSPVPTTSATAVPTQTIQPETSTPPAGEVVPLPADFVDRVAPLWPMALSTAGVVLIGFWLYRRRG